MEALRALVRHSPSIAKASPLPNSTETEAAPPTDSPNGTTLTPNKTLFVKTKFGVLIEFDHHLSALSITLTDVPTLSKPVSSAPPPSSGSLPRSRSNSSSASAPRTPTSTPPTPKYRYIIIPDWNTSCFWYDTDWPQNPDDEYHVDFDEIERRYPALYPHYKAWEELYEKEFEKQGCHLGKSGAVFAEKAVGDAWQVEGFLMACWVALQEDVDQVKFERGKVEYVIRRGNVGEVFKAFLEEMPAAY